MENAKPWYLSKTLWFNLISGLISILIAVQGSNVGLPESFAGYIGIAVAIMNILLRLITSQQIAM